LINFAKGDWIPLIHCSCKYQFTILPM